MLKVKNEKGKWVNVREVEIKMSKQGKALLLSKNPLQDIPAEILIREEEPKSLQKTILIELIDDTE